MRVAQLGSVLIAMAETARARADSHRVQHGSHNSALLWSLSFMLQSGAEKCIELAEEDQANDH